MGREDVYDHILVLQFNLAGIVMGYLLLSLGVIQKRA